MAQRSRAGWKKALKELAVSGLSVNEFARQKGVCPATIYGWKALLRDRGVLGNRQRSGTNSPGFCRWRWWPRRQRSTWERGVTGEPGWPSKMIFIVAYEYSSNRRGDTPKRVLGQTTGSLVVDDYSGYNQLTTPDKRQRANCNAHARRKFREALPTNPEAQACIDLYLQLFLIEQEAKDQDIVGTTEHLQLRQTKSGPVVQALPMWLLEEVKKPHLPKGKMAISINYALSNWAGLTRFLTDPKIPLSSNRSERFLRVVAQRRKGYLTIGNTTAGKHIAVLYTLTACCIEVGISPVEYYTDVLQRIDVHPKSRIDELLPHNWKRLREECQPQQA